MYDRLPTEAPAPAPEPTGPVPFHKDPVRMGGALLLVNAGLVFAQFFVLLATSGEKQSFVPGIIDLAIGQSMVQGNEKYKSLAVVRAALGLVFSIVLGVAQADACGTIVNVVGISSLLIVLAGKASPTRMTTGSVVFGGYAVTALVSMVIVAFVGDGA